MRNETSDSSSPLSDDLGPGSPLRSTSSTPLPAPAGPGTLPETRHPVAQDDAPEGTWEWDIDTGAVRWSDGTYRLFEVERGSYVPTLDGNAAFVHPEDRRPYHQALAATLRTGQPLDFDLRLITPSGEVKHCNSRASVVCDPDGRPVRLAGTCHDITARRRAELQRAFERQCLEASLAEATARLEKLRALGMVAGGIADDVNNVLGGLFGRIELARLEIAPDAPAVPLLDEALSSHMRARVLTGQLMRLAEKEAAPSLRNGKIDSLVHEVAGTLLSGSNVACEIRLEDDLWPCEFDKGLLGQAIGNILINARQAMPEGGSVLMEARNALRERDGDPGLSAGRQVLLSIADSGEGIPPEILQRIFDPFFSTRPGGQGLGLATAYSVIRKHGGSIAVESSAGRGSTFRIALPASSGEVEAIPSPARGEGHHGRRRGAILVMDDEDAIRKVLVRMLATLGYAAVEAPGGAEAVALCAQAAARGEHFTAAILDLTTPGGKGGKEAASELHAVDRRLPVFASSGCSEDAILSDPHRFGFSGGIAKPFRLDDLRRILSELFGDARRPS